MQLFLYHLELCAPLFSLVFIGWGLAKIHFIPEAAQKALGSVTFKLLMPALLFKMLSHLSEMPPADWRVLIPESFSAAVRRGRRSLRWRGFSATTCSSASRSSR